MKIAITGGNGFIGRATAKAAVAAGHEVFSFDRPERDVLGDLVGLKGADVVIHLAGVLGTAELFDEVNRAIQVNVFGSLRVLEYCAEHRIGYVGITMPDVFPSVYTATKVCADRLAAAWNNAKGVRVSRVRAFNAFGPGQKHGPGHPQKIIPTFAACAWEGKPIPIWGDGNQTVDLVHVDALGRLLVAAARFGNNEVFDGGTGVSFTVNEVAEMVLAITGSKAGVEHLPMRSGEVPTQICAEGKGWELLMPGEVPKFFSEELRLAVESYRP